MTPPRSAARRRVIVLVTSAAVALLVASGLVVALSGSDEAAETSAASDQTPEDAMRAYVEANNAEDCEAIAQHPISRFEDAAACVATFERSREEAEAQGFDVDPLTVDLVIEGLEVRSEDAVRAVVRLEVSQEVTQLDGDVSHPHNTADYTLVRIGGQWLVTDQEPIAATDG